MGKYVLSQSVSQTDEFSIASSRDMMATTDSTNDIQRAPAPWTLSGDFAYLFLHGSRSALTQFNEDPNPEKTPFRGGAGGILVVRYSNSPVGPYDELIVFPGCYQFKDTTYYRISQIYVSSMESVVNGRRNWAVPKKLAIFRWTDNYTRVQISLPGEDQPFCTLRVRPRLYCLPAGSGLIPASFRTLLQPALDDNGPPERYFRITPTCSGWFRPWVQLVDFQTDGKEIPSEKDLPVYRFGVGYEAFTLVFPEAEEILIE